MRIINLIHTLFCITFFGLLTSEAQHGVVATGGEATGDGGSVQRSTGLTDFRHFHSQQGSVQYGIQQSYQLYSLNLIAEPASGGSVQAEGKYSVGQEVSVSAFVNEDYEFINWSDEENFFVSGETSFHYLMPAKELTLTANFNDLHAETPVYSTLTLTMNFDYMGTIYPAEGFYKFMPGQKITITAVPLEEMLFLNWTDRDGNLVSKDPTFVYTLAVGQNKLKANFRDGAAVPLSGYAVIITLILAAIFIASRYSRIT